MSENLIISNSEDNFEKWLSKDFINDDLRHTLSNVDILVVPNIGFRKDEHITFPLLTEELFSYIKERLPKGVSIDICAKDDDIQILALHSNYKNLGTFVVKSIVVPVFVGILIAYVTENYIKHEDAKPQVTVVIVDNAKNKTPVTKPEHKTHRKFHEPSNVKFSITMVDSNGHSTDIKYEGPASEVHNVANEIKKISNADSTSN